MESSEYRIAPRLEYALTPDEAKTARSEAGKVWSPAGCGCAGCLSYVVVLILAGLGLLPDSEDTLVLVPILALAGLAIVWQIIYSSSSKDIISSKVKRATTEAQESTRRAQELLTTSAQLVESLPAMLDRAEASLRRAQDEYTKRAFAPFWDAIEHAARSLHAFHESANKLTGNVSRYYQLLDGRDHTFPRLPVRSDALPNPQAARAELLRLVRMGQRDFEFATIWEHRATREVLIAGFRTLGQAIEGLAAAVDLGLADLRNVLHSDLTRLVEEQIATRVATESIDTQIDEELRRRRGL